MIRGQGCEQGARGGRSVAVRTAEDASPYGKECANKVRRM